jgi:hypothetical protein
MPLLLGLFTVAPAGVAAELVAALTGSATLTGPLQTGTNPLEPDVALGSWVHGELGRFVAAAITNYRGIPTAIPHVGSGYYPAFLRAIEAYDTAGEPPYPFLQPEVARWFLDYMRKNGA